MPNILYQMVMVDCHSMAKVHCILNQRELEVEFVNAVINDVESTSEI